MNAYAITALPEITPVWHCLLVAPQKELATREHLRANGVYAFYPSREKRYTRQGKTVRIERPEVTGYVLARFTQQPNWYVLKERRRLITGVIGGSVPYAIHPDIIRHLQGLTVEAQRLEEARKEMMRVRDGDKAKVVGGPFNGFIVDVRKVMGHEAEVDLPIAGKVKTSLISLERVIGLS
jgi:transcription antitermination factor NusG